MLIMARRRNQVVENRVLRLKESFANWIECVPKLDYWPLSRSVVNRFLLSSALRSRTTLHPRIITWKTLQARDILTSPVKDPVQSPLATLKLPNPERARQSIVVSCRFSRLYMQHLDSQPGCKLRYCSARGLCGCRTESPYLLSQPSP